MRLAQHTRLTLAMQAIDDANAADPNRVLVDGAEVALAAHQGRLAVDWVSRLAIMPSDALVLAGRAHHLLRWSLPRATFPMDRSGYLAWRREARKHQVSEIGGLLRDVGYDSGVIGRVEELLATRGRSSDPEARILQDAVTLVFLATQFEGLAARLGPEKTIDVTAKTLAKMSPLGLAAAAELPGLPLALVSEAARRVGGLTVPADGLRAPSTIERTDRLINRALDASRSPAVTISTQLGGLVLLHRIRVQHPGIPVIFVDTGQHFPETLGFLEEIRDLWDLDLHVARPDPEDLSTPNPLESRFGGDRDQCCALLKVAPAERALASHDLWFAALRREQTTERASARHVEQRALGTGRTITKVLPLLDWTWEQIDHYAKENDIPRNPLHADGYTSIGCAPCTLPTFGTRDDRSGRWDGDRRECGLHHKEGTP